MSTSEPDYFYLPLRDAKKSLNMRINLMAKVSKIGTVRKSRGSDYVLVLKLVDRYESSPGLSVNLFADKLDKLPQARSTGDIISLHHVETSINYQAADNDKKILMQLRGTSENKPEQALVEPMPTLFCNLKAEENLTVVCKVFHVSETSDGDLVLFVWDATDSPLVTLQIALDMDGQKQTCLHPEVSLLSRETLCAFPKVGSIIRLIVSKDFEEISQLKGSGYWVKFCNVVFELQSGLWRGALTPNSYIKKLSDEDNHVQCRQRIFNGRNSSKVDALPLSVFPWPSNVTETDLAYSSYSTLMESLAYPEIMHKFTSIVRVVTSYPWQAKDLRSPATGNYRVRLTIEDPTARIHAYIFGEDGEKFFDGYPSIGVLSEKMKKLLGIKGSPALRNPPWIWCCLMSYYLDEKDPWGSRRYRIFGTTLIG
ncbi:protection of telomeres protein 1a-like isoform X2 [Phalaenopsis equestris]|uniref:protection of telomeres protein 1a-like isoform X2 n=1 Tax=Phalaenopsis equestris TaxID=78828 RepID=UPI0009E576AC|nr:protection of telomeres protein 1a-like isoform X2 [Phalaenopsis equestris]